MVEKTNEWREYDYMAHKPDFPIMEIVEFLAGKDAPNGSFKKGDIIKTSLFMMNTSCFSHWRPILTHNTELRRAAD